MGYHCESGLPLSCLGLHWCSITAITVPLLPWKSKSLPHSWPEWVSGQNCIVYGVLQCTFQNYPCKYWVFEISVKAVDRHWTNIAVKVLLCCVHEQSTNHISLRNDHRCYAWPPTASNMLRPIPNLISCAGVTGRWGLLFHAPRNRHHLQYTCN